MKFYTYAHIRNDTGVIFYIGKGSGYRAWHRRGRSEYWNRIATKHGYSVEILARWCDEDQAYQHERLLIDTFGDLGVELCNLTNGGEGWTGVTHSAKSRKKIGAAHKGKTPWWIVQGKEPPSTKGMKFTRSVETRAKISAAAKQRPPMSDATKAKIGSANKEKWASNETLADIV